MNANRPLLKLVVFGFAVGAITSIVPIELGLLVVPGLMALWIFAARRRPAGVGLRNDVMAGFAAAATISIAAILPVKQLDRKVGPIGYERLSLDLLCQALSRDYRVFARAPYPEGTNLFLAFRTDREMTRREVLQQLAADTGCELHIGYCGSGASFLFGAHPSFTRLNVKLAQQPTRSNSP